MVGIVSFGDGYGDMKKPGIYTRVASYINWIKMRIHRKSYTHHLECIVFTENEPLKISPFT